jgi:hypothetical protein
MYQLMVLVQDLCNTTNEIQLHADAKPTSFDPNHALFYLGFRIFEGRAYLYKGVTVSVVISSALVDLIEARKVLEAKIHRINNCERQFNT